MIKVENDGTLYVKIGKVELVSECEYKNFSLMIGRKVEISTSENLIEFNLYEIFNEISTVEFHLRPRFVFKIAINKTWEEYFGCVTKN